eukprot:1161673-Pelagomonas_calceolata.AAC.4
MQASEDNSSTDWQLPRRRLCTGTCKPPRTLVALIGSSLCAGSAQAYASLQGQYPHSCEDNIFNIFNTLAASAHKISTIIEKARLLHGLNAH